MTEKHEFDVVGLSRSFIDVIGHVPNSMLDQYGIPLDAGRDFDDVETIKEIESKIDNPIYCPGGSIGNTLAGLAAMGVKTGYFGKVAHDKGGDIFLDDLTARGIEILGEPYDNEASLSGICLVLLTEGGERSFALHKGCADAMLESDFTNFDFSHVKYFVIYTSFLSSSDDPLPFVKAAQLAKQQGCKVVFSLSEVRDWTDREDLAQNTVFALADILIGNEHEVKALFDLTGLMTREDCSVITTLGSRGAMGAQGQEKAHTEAFKGGGVISSLGAGDQFLAGYLKGELMQLPLEEKLALAVCCAGKILQLNEGRPAVGGSWADLIQA